MRSSRAPFLSGSVAIAALLALPACNGNRAEVDAWLVKIDAADALFSDVNDAWKAEALGFIDAPPTTSGPCEISDVHGGSDSVSLIEREALENEYTALREVSALRQDVNVARRMLAPETGRPTLPNEANAAAIARAESPDDWGYDWLLLTTATTEPTLVGDNTFKPGTASGWLMIWGYEEGRFVCAGAFEAENSDQVGVEGVGETGSLRWNLAAQAFETGQAALQAIPEG